MFTIPIQVFTYFNVLLIAYVLLSLFFGFRKGFLLSLLDILGFILAIVLAFIFAPRLAQMIPLMSDADVITQFPMLGLLIFYQVNTLIWFFILFVIISLVLLLLRPVLKSVNKIPLVGGINQILGAALGGLKALFFLWLLSLLLATPLFSNGQALVDESFLGAYQTLNIESPLNSSLNIDLLYKLSRQEDLTDEEEAAIQSYVKGIFEQEAFRSYVQDMFDSGRLSELDFADLQSWFNDLDALNSIESWWETVRP
jgi:uncharacterized membrane protein required for colicin V production